MFEAIASGTECACQRLCQVFPISKATISHHVKELVQAGLVEAERDGQFMHYRVHREIVEAYAAELLRRAGAGRRP
jgi:DNA-binding transcriptional ArsR family regulator